MFVSQSAGNRPRRTIAVVALVALVATMAVVLATPAAAKPPPRLQPQSVASVPGREVGPPPEPATTLHRRGYSVPAPVWPAPGAVDVEVAEAGKGRPVRAGGLPVRVEAAAVDPTAAGTPVSRVRVEAADRKAAQSSGMHGLLLKVRRADGVVGPGRARLSIDYGGFRYAYGADWASRLRLVPIVGGTATAVRNDLTSSVFSAEIGLAPDGATIMALDGGPTSSTGDYAATSLQASSTWAAGGSSGAFTWSYPMRVPPSLGGPSPEIELSYSSANVDGRTAASNNQPSWVGEGFDWQPGFIERRYRNCGKDTGGSSAPRAGDQCWATDNAILSFGGDSAELIKDSNGLWHGRSDDGSRIERRTGTANTDPDHDNNSEHWVLTTTDGTEYWFGRNRLPGWVSGNAETNATWTVPVYGNHTGEPCNATSYCHQAWRWNLDYVVDPHGNTMSFWYTRERNSYMRAAATLTPYTRGGHLRRIDYGTRSNTAYGTAPIQVDVETGDRCLSSCTSHDAAHWPDTPWDYQCTATPCAMGSPTFWTTRRLSRITTKVWGGSAYNPVESWSFTHTFLDPGDGTRAGLWLERISHSGLVGSTTTVPDVTFTGVNMPNRVDTTDRSPAMNWPRIASITTESGGRISVTYLNQDCVRGSRMPSAPHTNTLRCFPVRWTPEGMTDPIVDYFHKYVVDSVTESDLALPSDGRSPRTITSYTYVGDPAWHYTDDDGLIDDRDKTWSVWRGYGRVVVTTGDPGELTRTETLYFRGMNGDKLPTGTRSVSVQASEGPAVPDEDDFAGMPRDELVYDGPNNSVVSATISDPWRSVPTASRTIDGVTVYARHVDVAATQSRVALDGGRGWRRTSTGTTFDSLGMPIRQEERGNTGVTGDERCTLTTYVRNSTEWLMSYPQRVQTFGVDCTRATGTGLTEDDLISDERRSYDQQAYGVAPTRGLVSRVETLKEWPTTYLTTSRATHDAYGRVLESWDVRGNRTTAAYTPATGGPVTSTTTTNQLGWTTTSTLQPAWGTPTSTVDANGKVTDLAYDGLGRLISVWLPGRARTAEANIGFAYLVRNNGPTVVSTRRLTANGAYVTSHTLHDADLRARQTQAPAPGPLGGRIITDTFYDTAGRVTLTNGAYVADGAPSTNLFLPMPDAQIPGQTDTVYDGAGRTRASIFLSNGVEKWRTTTAYGGDRTDVTPPAGATATSTVVDGYGRTIELRQYHGPTPTGTYDATTYGHNRKGQLIRVTDPAGNRREYGYDLLGRRITTTDPDKGLTTATYNDAGDVLSTVDSRGEVLAYTYDPLGRRATLRDDSPTGAKRAEWVYDTLTSGAAVKGQLVKAIRWIGSGAYVNEVTGFDNGYRPTGRRLTVPLAAGLLSGEYLTGYGYHGDGSPASIALPAVGDLPSETLRLGYNALGLLDTLSTNRSSSGEDTSYVNGTGYTRLGELSVIGRRYDNGRWLDTGRYYETGTRRLNRLLTTRETVPALVADVNLRYDPAGNVVRIDDVAASDVQCLSHDRLRRLTEAWTPSGGDCDAARSVSGLAGPAPYWQSFTYDAVGNRRTSVDHRASGDTNRTYSYPDPGTTQPHTLRRVDTTGPGAGTASYTYDTAGNTLTRPGQTLTWDAEGRLAAVTEGGATTSFVYDADGNRLIRTDPGGSTLYLPDGQELRAGSGGVKTGTRYYAHAGEVIGMRTTSGLTWLASDHQGTSQISVNAATQAVTPRRQKPFGELRGGAVTWPNDKGFVGGTVDNTGTTHLGAREYDPVTGRFISVDPVVDHNDPQQMHGYAYANNTPVTMSDPDGLLLCGDDDCKLTAGPKPKNGGERKIIDRRLPNLSFPISPRRPRPEPGPAVPQPKLPPPVYCHAMLPGCILHSMPQLHERNIYNGSNDYGLDQAQKYGASCTVGRLQIVCFMPNHPLGRPVTVGDVLLYNGTEYKFNRELATEAKKRREITRMGWTRDHAPDIERHEAIHSDQWAQVPYWWVFRNRYYVEAARSCLDKGGCSIHLGVPTARDIYFQPGDFATHNKYEIEAGLHTGGYLPAPSGCGSHFRSGITGC